MKILLTILITIIVLFLLLFAITEILNVKIKFEDKNNQEQEQEIVQEENIINEEKNSPEVNSGSRLDVGKEKIAEEIIQDITELSAQILQQGTGDQQVKAGDKITVHYTGMLLDGTRFDSSVDRGQPFSLTIGAGQVIKGWDAGIIGMKIGEQRRLFIPSELAYGEQGAGELIGPNADLVFDVELISIDNEGKNVEDIVDEEIEE